jgi:hypothetical protein
MRRFSTVVALAAGALLAGTVSASAAISYTANQGLQSNGLGVAADRSNINNVNDGNPATFFSLGVGGALVATSSLGALGGSVIEVTFGTVNPQFPESAEVYLDFDLASMTGTLLGEIFNDGTAPSFNAALGTIVLNAFGGSTSNWTITLNSPPAPVGNIALLDTTDASLYGGSGEPAFTDGFDVGEFNVSEVPLPASVLMLLAALGGLGLFGRGRKVA